MTRHYRRDLIGHFIRHRQREQQPCTHACCRGYRVHPDNYPIVPPNRLLRHASDDDLAAHWDRAEQYSLADRERARAQVLYELNRRDLAKERREATEERRRARWWSRQAERQEEINRLWMEAEAGTKGNMLNRRGKEAGIDERTLFRGPETRARKYASEELLNWWDTHPRPTEAYFRGEESRLGYYQRGPRRRITSQEQRERDWYERIDADEHAHGAA
jgi:hypothetical protein